jgi:hypothetical protein
LKKNLNAKADHAPDPSMENDPKPNGFMKYDSTTPLMKKTQWNTKYAKHATTFPRKNPKVANYSNDDPT